MKPSVSPTRLGEAPAAEAGPLAFMNTVVDCRYLVGRLQLRRPLSWSLPSGYLWCSSLRTTPLSSHIPSCFSTSQNKSPPDAAALNTPEYVCSLWQAIMFLTRSTSDDPAVFVWPRIPVVCLHRPFVGHLFIQTLLTVFQADTFLAWHEWNLRSRPSEK